MKKLTIARVFSGKIINTTPAVIKVLNEIRESVGGTLTLSRQAESAILSLKTT